MSDDNFEDWKITWEANLAFHLPISQALKCIICNDVKKYPEDTHRSIFWLDGTRCSVGHRQATITEMREDLVPGVCASCDQDFMLKVLTGKVECRRKGCRRIMRLNELEVRSTLLYDPALLKKFLELASRRKVYECAIHCEDVEFGSDPAGLRPPTSACNHDRNVCNNCLTAAFETAIRGGRLKDLICPDPECKRPIPSEKIKSLVSSDVFKIYNKKLAQEKSSQIPKFRWCSCGHGQVHEPGESNPEWTCLKCKKRHCYICHDNTEDTCEHLRKVDMDRRADKGRQRNAAKQFVERKRQEAIENVDATKREIARTTKKCPKLGCGNRIERSEGCGHFTCKNCRTEFCWSCKVIWRNRKALHLHTCEIGTKRYIARADMDLSGYANDWDKDPGYDKSLDSGLWLTDNHM